MILTKRQAFLEFSKEYQSLKEGEKSEFSRICNKLLQVNFLTIKKANDANDYRFFLAYKDLFTPFFALLDFEVIIKRDDGVAFIVNESNYNHLRLRKTESILLLILRILYQKKKETVTLGNDIEIFLYEVHDELTKIGYLDNKRITKNELKPSLQMFRNYNIIDYIDTGLHDDCRLKIYPTIVHVTNLNEMSEILDKLDEYVKEGLQKEE